MQLIYNTVVDITTEYNKKFILAYSITGTGREAQYGISVLKDENGQIEEKTVNSISSDKNEIISLIKVLAENKVTPVAVLDVIYDYICKKYTLNL